MAQIPDADVSHSLEIEMVLDSDRQARVGNFRITPF
jgi:hypothetical protein